MGGEVASLPVTRLVEAPGVEGFCKEKGWVARPLDDLDVLGGDRNGVAARVAVRGPNVAIAFFSELTERPMYGGQSSFCQL